MGFLYFSETSKEKASGLGYKDKSQNLWKDSHACFRERFHGFSQILEGVCATEAPNSSSEVS